MTRLASPDADLYICSGFMSAKARICCLDLDTFFVSVERLLDPSLVGKPVVVGGRKGGRGVVTAASYEVREFGVRSGMAIGEATRLAPQAIFIPTRHGTYSGYAKKVRAILERFTPEVQTASIDEFYLDFYGCERLYQNSPLEKAGDFGDAIIARTVERMRADIRREVGLPASVGIGGSKTVAKIASGLAKPDGVFLMPVGMELELLRPLPVRKMPGIGPATEQRLHSAGIFTLGQLLDRPRTENGDATVPFGRLAESVRNRLRPKKPQRLGRNRPAFLEHDAPGTTVGSISNERTFFDDLSHPERINEQLLKLSERVCWRARKRDVFARTITLKLRYRDFQTLTRSRTGRPTQDEHQVYECVVDLFRRNKERALGIRLLGIALSNLVGPDPQLGLPFDPPQKKVPVDRTVDSIRERFGYDAIRLGATTTSRWLT
jgi:DNA polymerase-4